MAFSFVVHDVELGDHAVRLIPLSEHIKPLLNLGERPRAKIEASDARSVVAYRHSGFFDAFSMAYNSHLPLAISPDAVWLAILRGVAAHIDKDPEGLRHHFVKHKEKKHLHIARNDFVKGYAGNNWPGCFAEFTTQMKEHIGKRYDLLVSNFTTTGPVERAASEVSLMSAMKNYFSYGMTTACGFPRITIEGEPADWTDIIERTRVIAEFDLDWWTKFLLPVLEEFLRASNGTPDIDFWQRAYLESGGGSGPTYISGWINYFFPYVKGGIKGSLVRNSAMTESVAKKNLGKRGVGNASTVFPDMAVSAPVDWDYHGIELKMEFIGGILGVTFDTGRTLRPQASWSIIDTGEVRK